ncbi:hypothetical protein [Spartinivicinus ruber]|uniref:hypothetical protein n=1 Tax=Spartinivicinus ruber TaxID=2683272 RepID=UPI0015B65CF1|nr:hypothetical protein [Spartinivicinus ruber]
MNKNAHTELCQIAKRWLLNTVGCSFAFSELRARAFTSEEPDAIGWKQSGSESYLIEVKVSRSNFHADKKKFFRLNPEFGVGRFRYFMTPPKLLTVDDLPPGWGLLEVQGKKQIKVVHGFHPKKRDGGQEFVFQINAQSELAMMASMLRRVKLRIGDLQDFTSKDVLDYESRVNKLKKEIRELEQKKKQACQLVNYEQNTSQAGLREYTQVF